MLIFLKKTTTFLSSRVRKQVTKTQGFADSRILPRCCCSRIPPPFVHFTDFSTFFNLSSSPYPLPSTHSSEGFQLEKTNTQEKKRRRTLPLCARSRARKGRRKKNMEASNAHTLLRHNFHHILLSSPFPAPPPPHHTPVSHTRTASVDIGPARSTLKTLD